MKVTLYMTQSLDGYISGPNGETPWTKPVWDAYYSIVKEKKSMIVGRKTYELMEEAGDELEKCGHPLVVVLSETRSSSTDGKTMFAKTPDEAIAIIKGQGFTETLLGGGGDTNNAFLTAGLIDDAIIDIEPLLLGSGTRLFGGSAQQIQMSYLETKLLAPQVLRINAKIKK